MFFPKLSQIATQKVTTLSDDHTIQQAADLMDARNIRDVVITGAQGLRMITPRELIALRLQEVNFKQPLAQVELQRVNSICQQKNILDGLNALKDGAFEYLCLLDAQQHLCGIVSYSDIIANLDPHYLSEFKRINDLVRLSNFISVDVDASVKDVLITLRNQQEFAALVKQGEQHVGIVTQRDITHALAQNLDTHTPISQVMTSPLVTINGEATLQQALAFSREKHFKRLVVTQHDGKVMGVLHQKDLVALVYENWRNLIDEQQRHLQAEKELFKGGPVLLFIWQPEDGWPVHFVSDNIESILGYPAHWVRSDDFKFSDLLHPDDVETAMHEVVTFLAQQQPFWEQTYRLRHQDGSYRWFYDYTRPAYDAQGKASLIYGYLLDQTQLMEAKNQAQQAQSRLELALEASETGLWVWDMQANTIDWSDQAFTQIGYAPQAFEVNLDVFQQLVHPDDLAQMFATIQRQVSEQHGFVVEFRVKHAQGDWTWLQGRGKVTRTNTQGEPIQMMGTHLNIDSQKHLTQRLIEQENRFRGVFENTRSGVAIYRPIDDGSDFEFVDFNPSAERIEQVTKQQVIGKRLTDIFPMAEAFGILAALKRVCLTGESEQMPMSAYQDNRVQGWRENILFRLETGEVVAVYEDLTELKKSEETLRLERERLENIIWGTGVGTWQWNVQTGETIFNARWAELIGYELAELQPTTIDTWMRFAHDDDLAESQHRLQAHFNGEVDDYTVEARMRHTAGHWIWVLDRGKVVSWTEDGKPLWMAGTHQDITERKQAEIGLQQAKDELERNERLLEDGEALAKIGGWEYEVATQKMYWTEGLFKLHEFQPDPNFDHIAQSTHCYRPEDQATILAAFQRCVEQGEAYDLLFPFTSYGGKHKWIRTKTVPMFDEQGKVTSVVGIVADISEQRETEQQLTS